MHNLKPFNAQDVDETLTRVVAHGDATYLLFPYISAMGHVPKFDSVSYVIGASAATIEEFAALRALVNECRVHGEWFISFNTPWLIAWSDAEIIRQRVLPIKPRRG